MMAKPHLIKSIYIRQRLLVAVFNSEGCFCLFIEPHNAGFSKGVLSVGARAPPIGRGRIQNPSVEGGGGKSMWQAFIAVKCNSCINANHRPKMKMFLNSLKNQLNLLFEILKTIFLNFNVLSFQVTIGGIKTLWG